MKRRWVTGILLVILTCLFLLLNRRITDAGDYSGAWYRSSDGVRYDFENGIIRCETYGIALSDDAVFSGAYSYGKNSVLVFFAEEDGVGEVLELQLVHQRNGDILCENRDGHRVILFCRKPNAGNSS